MDFYTNVMSIVDKTIVIAYNGADDENRTHNKTGVGILSGTLYTPALLTNGEKYVSRTINSI